MKCWDPECLPETPIEKDFERSKKRGYGEEVFMLKLGEKGAISQRDNQTYAVAPHIPCGVVTPEQLKTGRCG